MGEYTAKSIAGKSNDLTAMGIDAAVKQAAVLIGSYPAKEIYDADIFTRAIVSVLAETPLDIGKTAVDHLTRTHRWLPTRADVAAICGRLTDLRRQAQSTVANRFPLFLAEIAAKEKIPGFLEKHGEAWKAWKSLPGFPYDAPDWRDFRDEFERK